MVQGLVLTARMIILYLPWRHGTRGRLARLRTFGSVARPLCTLQPGCDAVNPLMVEHSTPSRGRSFQEDDGKALCRGKYMQLTSHGGHKATPSVDGVPLMGVCGSQGPRMRGKLAITGVAAGDGDPSTAWRGGGPALA